MAKLRNAGFILIAVLFLALSWGCHMDTTEPIEDGVIFPKAPSLENIKQSYIEVYRLNIAAINYDFGVYNGCVPVYVPLPTGKAVQTIADIQFSAHYNGAFLNLWRDGQFYVLEEAYNLGMVTLDDLISLKDYHDNRFDFCTDDDTLFVPKPKNPDVLNEEIKSQIMAAFSPPYTYHMIFGPYLGTYNDSVALCFDSIMTMVTMEYAAGIPFYSGNLTDWYVWQGEQHFGLQAAYDIGLVTRDDLLNIQYHWDNRYK